MFVPVKCHIRTNETHKRPHSIPTCTSLACPVVVLLCFACLVFRTILRPFEATKTRGVWNVIKTFFVDENRMKEMRGKNWSVPDLIAKKNSKW